MSLQRSRCQRGQPKCSRQSAAGVTRGLARPRRSSSQDGVLAAQHRQGVVEAVDELARERAELGQSLGRL
jgi:hypothetical protein